MNIKKEIFNFLVYLLTGCVGVFSLMFDYLKIYFLFLMCYSYYIHDV